MTRVEQAIEVNVPVNRVWRQWTRFEEFPRFMEGVREVKRVDETHLHWRAQRHGREVEWDSEITHQMPGERIDWRDVSGPQHVGSILISSTDDQHTQVRLTMEVEPDPSGQASGEAELNERMAQDLERFKHLVETESQTEGGPYDVPMGKSAGTGMPTGDTRDASGGSAAHPSGRWEAWTDEETLGGIGLPGEDGRGGAAGGSSGTSGSSGMSGTSGTSGTSGGTSRSAASSEAGASADPTSGSSSAGGGSSGGASSFGERGRGAQAWLRNQFPNLDEPLGMMRRMTEEMDQLFERFIGRPIASRFGQGQGGQAGKWMPQIEIHQAGAELVVCADLPGVRREDVQLEVLHDRLTLEGERHEAHERSEPGYRRSERCYGRFYRMIPLPHGVDPDAARATLRDGVLEVRIPMPSVGRPARKVDVG